MTTHQDSVLSPFAKEDYMTIIREKRSQFVNDLYHDKLQIEFAKLRVSANEGINCHHEITFSVESHHNIDCIETYLLKYFQDIGYQPIIEPRKVTEGQNNKITLTLT